MGALTAKPCSRCGATPTRVYQPRVTVHPNGYRQTRQDAWCSNCQRPYQVGGPRLGWVAPTLPPPDREGTCSCGETKSPTAARCQRCAVEARTFLPQATSKGWYRGRQRRAPGLTYAKRVELLTKWQRQRRRCAYCSSPADTVDHVIPLSRGGDNREGNLAPSCRRCNSSKGSRLLVEWRARRAAQPSFLGQPRRSGDPGRAGLDIAAQHSAPKRGAGDGRPASGLVCGQVEEAGSASGGSGGDRVGSGGSRPGAAGDGPFDGGSGGLGEACAGSPVVVVCVGPADGADGPSGRVR